MNALKKNSIIFIILFIVSVLIGTFLYIDRTLRPTITVLAETKALEIANKSINKSVADVVKGQINYQDLMDVKLDSDGKITMIQANTVLMNTIASDVALDIQDELKKIKSTSSYIPIGTALGSPILATYGPKLKISIEPIGTVTVNFKTDFESSGINQTRHIVYIDVNTKARVVIPLTTTTQEINVQIPICETIIVGNVPQSYVNIPEASVQSIVPNLNSNE